MKAKKPGKVTVTVKVGDYTTSKTYDITVYATISGAATVGVGKTSQYTLDTNAEGTPVWSVSDEKSCNCFTRRYSNRRVSRNSYNNGDNR